MKHADGLPNSWDVLRVPAPLVIGVSGHRDLRPGDLYDLINKVQAIFRNLRELYPSTPFILLSALAEGADRLVARVALEPENRTRLVVPLPMPQPLYETDFETAASLEDFRALLAQADYSFEIPLPNGVSQDAVAERGPARDHQYELQGKYLALQSQILIALWDGVDSGKTGGTSEVVKFQTQGLPRGDCDLETPELFPVYRIVTPRASNPVPAGTPFSLIHIYPPAFGGDLKKAEGYYEQAFGNADEFNRLMVHGGPKLAAQAAQSKKDCVGDLDEGQLTAKEALMLGRYGFADALAIRYQKWWLRAHRWLHVLVFVSYCCFVLSAEIDTLRYQFLGLSVFFLFGALWIYFPAKHVKLDNKTEDYRALAEGCRVRFFWQLAGIHDSVADHYLGEQRTELDWIRRGLFGWEVDLQAGWPGSWAEHRQRIEFVLEHWVDNQQRYFRKAHSVSHFWARQFGRTVQACVIIAAVLAVVVLFAGFAEVARAWTTKHHEIHAIIVEALLAAGAIGHHYSERRAHHEHRKQYGRMLAIFQNAARMLRAHLDSNDLDGARLCLHKLGTEALEESGSWVLLHRARPLELPHP
jgi:hypothetical protein